MGTKPNTPEAAWENYLASLRAGGFLKDDEEARVFAEGMGEVAERQGDEAYKRVLAHRERKRILAESKDPDELLALGLSGKLPGPPK